MQLEFVFNRGKRPVLDEFLVVNGKNIPVLWVRNLRARRYILRLDASGCARVTIPRRGSQAEARRFAERQQRWLERQLRRLAERPAAPRQWTIGSAILFRGELVKLESASETDLRLVKLGGEMVSVKETTTDLRPQLEHYMRGLAVRELTAKVVHFSGLHGLPVRRVTIRNQRSRWGSCSRRGTISLNWRLIQTPGHVQDYIILHELCHLLQMNHSRRFWREVERVCPEYQRAEEWLKRHGALLG